MISFSQFLILLVLFVLLFGDTKQLVNKVLLVFYNIKIFFKKDQTKDIKKKKINFFLIYLFTF